MRIAISLLALALASVAPAAPAQKPKTPSTAEAGGLQALQERFQAAFTQREWHAAADALQGILAIQERTAGPESPIVLTTLSTLGIALQLDGRPAEAEPLFRRELAGRRKTEGENTAAVARAYNSVGFSIDQQNRFADAEPFYRGALASHIASSGANSPEAAQAHTVLANNLGKQAKNDEALREAEATRVIVVARNGPESKEAAEAYDGTGKLLANLGRYAEAEAQHRHALTIFQKELGANELQTIASMNNLGIVLTQQGKYAEAEAVLRRALNARRASAGPRDPFVPDLLSNLATAIQNGGNPAAAEPMLREALAMREEISGPDSPGALTAVNNVATCLSELGRYAEAEPFARRAFEGRLRLHGENHPETAIAAGNLAAQLASLGRDTEAEALYRRALAIDRATLGDEHPNTATAYANLATALAAEGRFTESEELQRRALAIRRRALAPDNPDIADNLQNIGYLLGQQRNYADADPLLRESLELYRRKFGENSLATARATNNVAANLDSLGRGAEAAPLYAKAYDARRRLLGPDHPLTLVSLNNLAYSRYSRGDTRGAVTLFRQAVDSQRRLYGPDNPARVTALTNFAMALSEDRVGQAEALTAAREASGIAARRRAAIVAGSAAGGDQAAQAQVRARSDELLRNDPLVTAYIGLMQVDWRVAAQDPSQLDALRAEAFAAGQEIDLSKAGLAMARTAARTAAGGGPLGRLVARQQALTDQIAALDQAYTAALARGDNPVAQRITAESAAAARDLAAIDAQVAREFPNYSSLIAPTASTLAEIRRRLQPGEGLLFIVPSNGDMFSFAVSRDKVAWHRAPERQMTMKREVATLLCQVDIVTCATEPTPRTAFERDGYPAFDRATAFALYRDMIQPVESALGGVKTLYVTATGTLGTIPLEMLVTAAPPSGDDADPAVLAATPWLADRYAIVSLPAVSMMRAIERPATGTRTSFVGYGAPALGSGNTAPAQRGRGVRAPNSAVFRATGQGPAMADQALLRSLDPLPGTQRELSAMATALQAPRSSLRLAAADTETALKRDRAVPNARVLAFATHGLLPRELGRFDEAGLVFTPPAQPSVEDDGVLAASEAAQLRLSADWVILSACNTAGADGGTEALSGLSRAFLYAGARSLLASHWRVSDDATAVLTVETLAADATMSRAAALQAGAKTVRTGRRADGSAIAVWDASWAHPMLWAPFSLVADRDE